MKAVAVFPARRELDLIDLREPDNPGAREVKLKILEVGVCGTDREICAFEYGTPPPGDSHLVIGHESLAEVLAVGSEVERLAPGDLVVPSVRRPCSHATCMACPHGRQDFCFTGDFRERGIKEAVLENQVVLGTVNAGDDAFESAIQDLAAFAERWPAALSSLITGRHPIEDYRPLPASASGIKSVISFA